LRRSLAHARASIASAAQRDLECITHVRAPYGHITPGIVARLNAWGYRPVMGSLAPAHWLQPRAITMRQVTRHLANGSLVVLHESLGGPSVDELTVEIIGRANDRGLTCVSVEQMWAEWQAVRRATTPEPMRPAEW
jgi:hypothetical protein